MILASGDGTLENVLLEVFKEKAQELQRSQALPKNLEELRANVRDAFVKASADGTLREALSADQRDREKLLRAQARNTFAKASLDGRLGGALADLHKSRQAGVPTIRIGDFRSCPNSAWQQLHAKFPPKGERKLMAGAPKIKGGDFRSCPTGAFAAIHAKFPPATRKE